MDPSQFRCNRVKLATGCHVCGKEGNLEQCAQCKVVSYCGREHQREDWRSHKVACKEVKKAYDRLEEREREVSTRSQQLGSIRFIKTRMVCFCQNGSNQSRLRPAMERERAALPKDGVYKPAYPLDWTTIADKLLEINSRRAVETALAFMLETNRVNWGVRKKHNLSQKQKICCCLIRLGRDQEAYNHLMHWTSEQPETFESLIDHDLLESPHVWATKQGDEHDPVDAMVLKLIKMRVHRGIFEERYCRDNTGVGLSQAQIDHMIATGNGYITQDIIDRGRFTKSCWERVAMDINMLLFQLKRNWPEYFEDLADKDSETKELPGAMDCYRAWSETPHAFWMYEEFKGHDAREFSVVRAFELMQVMRDSMANMNL